MSLAHAILGLLQNAPMTGYDLKNTCFNGVMSHLWAADQAQIYRTLDKLVEQGYATSTIEVQHDHPNRKVYSITDAGDAELLRWLAEPQPLYAVRDHFLLRLFFGAKLSNTELVRLLEDQRDAHAARLATYETLHPPTLDDPAITRTQTLRRLTLEYGFNTERAAIAWFDWAIAYARDLPPQTAPEPSLIEALKRHSA